MTRRQLHRILGDCVLYRDEGGDVRPGVLRSLAEYRGRTTVEIESRAARVTLPARSVIGYYHSGLGWRRNPQRPVAGGGFEFPGLDPEEIAARTRRSGRAT